MERVFPIQGLLEVPAGAEEVVAYYRQSLAGYLLVHTRSGAVHFALDGDDFSAQPRIVADHLPRTKPVDVLELASGLGYNALCLADQVEGARVRGVDLTPWHVRIARLRARRRASVSFECGDFHRLRFAAGGFDAVYAIEGFCHASDLRAALGEVARVLRPGGRFIVIDGFHQRPVDLLGQTERLALRLIDSAMAVSRAWTLDDLLTAAAELGLHHVATEDLTSRALPNAERLGRIAGCYLRRPRAARALARVLPPKLIRNAIAGALGAPAARSGLYGYHAAVLQR